MNLQRWHAVDRHPATAAWLLLAAIAFPVVSIINARVADWHYASPIAIHATGTRISVVASRADVRRNGWQLGGRFDVTSEGLVLLESDGAIINVLAESAVLATTRDDLTDFGAVGAGLVAVCGEFVCAYEDHALIPAVRLPQPGMRLSGSVDGASFLVFSSGPEGGDIFRFDAGGGYQKLVHLSQAISDVIAAGDRVFFAASPRILTWAPGEEVATIASFDDGAPISSLAFDPRSGFLFFAAGEGVFAVAEGDIIPLLGGVTGDLKFSHEVLFVKDLGQSSILAVAGAPQAVLASWRRLHPDG